MLINVDKVTHITIHPAVKSDYYFYKHKRWFFGLRPRGFYTVTLLGIPKRIKSLPDTLEFKNNQVYWKPYITINLSNDWFNKHFDSEEELKTYVKAHFNKFLNTCDE